MRKPTTKPELISTAIDWKLFARGEREFLRFLQSVGQACERGMRVRANLQTANPAPENSKRT